MIEYETQLNELLDEFHNMRERVMIKNKQQDVYDTDLPFFERQVLVTRAIAAIRRVSGDNSSYIRVIEGIQPSSFLSKHVTYVMGTVKALRDDIKAGYISSLIELVHSDIFSDFIEMAEHLCGSGYKDAAAVIIGSTLESHLRNLCQKSAISVETQKADGSVIPKKADAINSELASTNIYSKLDQKNVTAWLDLRNKAAHGKYSEYTKEQVSLLIFSVRDFITRHPA